MAGSFDSIVSNPSISTEDKVRALYSQGIGFTGNEPGFEEGVKYWTDRANQSGGVLNILNTFKNVAEENGARFNLPSGGVSSPVNQSLPRSSTLNSGSSSNAQGIPNGFVSNVDPQIKQAFLENYEFAKGVANQPYQAYTGPRVAQFSGDQQLLFDKVRQMANQPQSFLAGNINQYMNPYQDEVINRFQTDLERQRQLADQNVNANAVSRGAFGGSRQAVAQSENTRNFMDTSARNLANLRAQGFDTAAQLMQSDINRANQGLNFLGQTGALQQGQVQRNYDTAYQDFLQQRDYPLKQLQIRGIGLGQQLPNFGIQQTPPTPQTNTAGNALGGALIGSQIGAGFGGGFLGSNTGQILGAIGGGLLGGFL